MTLELPERPAQSPDRAALIRAIADVLLASGAALDAETRETPERVAKAWLDELLDGYGRDPVAELRGALVPAPRAGEVVIVGKLAVRSMCPHHLLPVRGTCALGFVTEGALVGFGKLPDALDALAHRLILQETLAHRLCAALVEALAPRGAGVAVRASHDCMQLRGPKAAASEVLTIACAGEFERDAGLRAQLVAAL